MHLWLVKRTAFLGLGWLTLLGFSALGFGIVWFFSDLEPQAMFDFGWDPTAQVALGFAYGAGSAGIGWLILRHPQLRQTRLYYSRLIQGMKLRFIDILFISVCAGVGEEILFRGALQYYFGAWPVVVVFVAIHGYLNPRDLKITAYGLYMTLVIGVMAMIYEEVGLWFAIAAHFAIDLVLLQRSLRDLN